MNKVVYQKAIGQAISKAIASGETDHLKIATSAEEIYNQTARESRPKFSPLTAKESEDLDMDVLRRLQGIEAKK